VGDFSIVVRRNDRHAGTANEALIPLALTAADA
jgi:hypothetical protein